MRSAHPALTPSFQGNTMSRTTRALGAAAALFLAGDQAGYISGAVLPVDGGLGMGH